MNIDEGHKTTYKTHHKTTYKIDHSSCAATFNSVRLLLQIHNSKLCRKPLEPPPPHHAPDEVVSGEYPSYALITTIHSLYS